MVELHKGLKPYTEVQSPWHRMWWLAFNDLLWQQWSENIRCASWARLCSTQILRLTRLWLIWQSRWLNSDSTKHLTFLDWLNSDSTQITNFQTWLNIWLNSFESELSQICLTTHHILANLAESCWPGGGGGGRPNVVVGLFFPCKTTDKCKILTFLFRKISASTLTQAVSSWLNTDSNDDQRDSTLTRLIFLHFHGRLDSDSTRSTRLYMHIGI